MKVILKADVKGSGKKATSSKFPTDLRRIKKKKKVWRKSPRQAELTKSRNGKRLINSIKRKN